MMDEEILRQAMEGEEGGFCFAFIRHGIIMIGWFSAEGKKEKQLMSCR